MSIYKACDIRGTYGEDLTSEVVLKIGRAVGFKMARKRVVVGGDVRLSTPTLKKAIISGLVSSGCQVFNIGIVPTPTFYFAKRYLRAEGGIMITASHNPPQFNGLKIILGDLPITPEEIEEIRRFSEKGKVLKAKGELKSVDIIDEYKEYIKGMFRPDGRYKVVVDAANGCYSQIAPWVLSNLGYEVKEICCQMDGRFPGHLPNPAVKENLRYLSQEVQNTNADLGIGLDCDGDRVVFVDEKGKVIDTDKSIVIIARYLLGKRNNGKVVYDLKCSSVVPEEVTKAGGIPLMEKSGHAFIKRRVIEEKAILGGEISGHFFYDFFEGGDDGLYSSLLMLKIMSETRKKLSVLASQVPSYYTTPDIRVTYDKSDKLEILDKIKDALSSYEISTLDGVRVVLPQGWGLVRLSISEPLLTFRFETKVAEDLPFVMDKFLAPVPHIREMVYKKYSEIKEKS